MSACCCGAKIKMRSFLFYISPDSPCQKLNPLTKLIIVITISIAAFIIDNIYGELGLLTIVLLGLLAARIPLNTFKLPIIGISGLLLISAVTYALFSEIPGETVYFTFPWGTYISEKTIEYVGVVYLRFLISCLINLIFLCTTREAEIKALLHFLHLPHSVCFILVLSFRVVSILLEDWWNIVEAQRARGMSLKGSIVDKSRRLLELMIPMISGVLMKIGELNRAIVVRNFTISKSRRTQIRKIEWNTFDYALSSLSISLLIGLIVAKYHYNYFQFS